MRVLVVDDEPVARRRLIRMLERIEGVELAGEAGDGNDARDKIAQLGPDVVLLDIHMPGLDGLTLAKTTPDLPPIIFTTAYDEHAVEAFEACAIDYLMKPVKQARLEQALAKVRMRGVDASNLMRLLERLAQRKALTETLREALTETPREARDETTAPKLGDHRVVARDGDALRVFDAREIGRFHATDKYSTFQHQGREYLLEESLHSLEERLAVFDFVRVHRAELISLEHVVALRPDGSGGVVELRDGQSAQVSRRHLAELKRALRIDG